ncbi:WXG100 family type VII secretion target [Couchioplanes caeruleus]|nr:WXG100 family type VII secretion target [Couchioplanes caeruleus]
MADERDSQATRPPELKPGERPKIDDFEDEKLDWRQLKALITGSAAVEVDFPDMAQDLRLASVDPNSLFRAGDTMITVRRHIAEVANNLRAQAAAIAGEGKVWQGAGAESFLSKMTQLGDGLEGVAEELAGGDDESSVSISSKLYDAGNMLQWAQNQVNFIDHYYATWALALGAKKHSDGLVHISEAHGADKLKKQMAEDMRKVLRQVATRYEETSAAARAIEATSTGTSSSGGGGPETRIPPPTVPNGPPPTGGPPNGPNDRSPNGDSPNGQDGFNIPRPEGGNFDIPSPDDDFDIPSSDGGNSAIPSPDGDDFKSPSGDNFTSDGGKLDIPAPDGGFQPPPSPTGVGAPSPSGVGAPHPGANIPPVVPPVIPTGPGANGRTASGNSASPPNGVNRLPPPVDPSRAPAPSGPDGANGGRVTPPTRPGTLPNISGSTPSLDVPNAPDATPPSRVPGSPVGPGLGDVPSAPGDSPPGRVPGVPGGPGLGDVPSAPGDSPPGRVPGVPGGPGLGDVPNAPGSSPSGAGIPPAMPPASPGGGQESPPDRSESSGLLDPDGKQWQPSPVESGLPDAPTGASPGRPGGVDAAGAETPVVEAPDVGRPVGVPGVELPSVTSAPGAGGPGAMMPPAMPPPSPGGGQESPPDRSESSGLLDPDGKQWQPAPPVPDAPDAPVGVPPGRAGIAGSGVDSPAAAGVGSPDLPVAGPGSPVPETGLPATGQHGGVPGGPGAMMPPAMPPPSPGGGQNSPPDRSEASGLLDAASRPWDATVVEPDGPDAPAGAAPGRPEAPPVAAEPPDAATAAPEKATAGSAAPAGVPDLPGAPEGGPGPVAPPMMPMPPVAPPPATPPGGASTPGQARPGAAGSPGTTTPDRGETEPEVTGDPGDGPVLPVVVPSADAVGCRPERSDRPTVVAAGAEDDDDAVLVVPPVPFPRGAAKAGDRERRPSASGVQVAADGRVWLPGEAGVPAVLDDEGEAAAADGEPDGEAPPPDNHVAVIRPSDGAEDVSDWDTGLLPWSAPPATAER